MNCHDFLPIQTGSAVSSTWPDDDSQKTPCQSLFYIIFGQYSGSLNIICYPNRFHPSQPPKNVSMPALWVFSNSERFQTKPFRPHFSIFFLSSLKYMLEMFKKVSVILYGGKKSHFLTFLQLCHYFLSYYHIVLKI